MIKVTSWATPNHARFFFKSLMMSLLDNRTCFTLPPASIVMISSAWQTHARQTPRRSLIPLYKGRSPAHYLRRSARNDRSGAKRPCATSTLPPSRLFPIDGALPSCGISYGSEAAPGLDSNEMSYSPLKWAGTARRILVARLRERPGNKLSPCDLDQNTRSKERTGLLRVQQSFSGCGSVPNVIPQALRLCGVTGNLADHRFEQNKNGYQSGWAVRKYDVRLVPRVYEHLRRMPSSNDPTVQMELELAKGLLRILGHGGGSRETVLCSYDRRNLAVLGSASNRSAAGRAGLPTQFGRSLSIVPRAATLPKTGRSPQAGRDESSTSD